MMVYKYIGYYLHKDGTPTVADISEIDSVKKDYKYYKYLLDDKAAQEFLETYNAGFAGNRMNIKPFKF